MKRWIAFLLSLTMLSCAACGRESEDMNPDAASAEQNASASGDAGEDSEPEVTENSPEPDNSEEASDDEALTPETESDGDREAAGYEEAVRAYFTYLLERDIEGILHLTYPDAYAETLRLGAEAQGYSLSGLLDSFEDNTSGQFRLDSMREEESLGAEECREIGEGLGEFRYQLAYIQTHGVESLLSGNIGEMDEADVQKYAYQIPEAYIVNCSVIMDTEDGEESDEQILLVYYIEDEGWKIEASMIGYVRKSKQTAANINAKSIYNAALTESVEMDYEDKVLPVSAMISSDSSRDYGIDAAFSAEFKEGMKHFFDALDEQEYFIVIRNRTIDSVVCRDAANADYIGRYPEAISSDNKLSFDELYESCLSELE